MSSTSIAKTIDQLKASTNETTISHSAIDRDISDISHKCSTIAVELLAELEKLKVRKDDSKRKIIVSSLRAMRKKNAIKEIQDKLDKYKRLLDARILVRLDAHSMQQRNDFSSLNREVQNLVLTLTQDHKALYGHMDNKFEDHARLDAEKDAQLRFKESLFYPEILARQEQIKEAHRGTCQWIFQSHQDETSHETDDKNGKAKERPWSDFDEWLCGGQELYWISGKVGSGKSTLMEFLRSEKSHIDARLAHWAGDTDLMTVFFYFCNPGTELQKSTRGLLRSLLYQIVDQRPNLVHLMMDRPQGTRQKTHDSLNPSQLHEWTERRQKRSRKIEGPKYARIKPAAISPGLRR